VTGLDADGVEDELRCTSGGKIRFGDCPVVEVGEEREVRSEPLHHRRDVGTPEVSDTVGACARRKRARRGGRS
jgi:hypothetical protein